MGNLCANGETNEVKRLSRESLAASPTTQRGPSRDNTHSVSMLIPDPQLSEIKILCLGSGESGKSTFNRQMRFIYNNNKSKASEDDRRKTKQQIHNDMIRGMRALLLLAQNKACSERIGLELDASSLASVAVLETEQPKKSGNYDLTSELGNCIQQLWKDRAVRACWHERVDLWPLLCAANSVHKELYASLEAYFDSTARIQEDTYVPTSTLQCHFVTIRPDTRPATTT
jgi:hypothetical protein